MSEAISAEREKQDGNSAEDVAACVYTSGKPIRSLVRLPTALVDEAKMRFDADGIHCRAVDPANVGLVSLTAHGDGFEDYAFHADEEVTVGVNLHRLQNALEFARMRGDGDPVQLQILTDPTRIRVTVTREDQGLKRTSEWFHLDPESIRSEPDPPDLDLPCYADPNPCAFRDAVAAFEADHATIEYDDAGGLRLCDLEGDDEFSESATFPNCAWTDDEDAAADAVSAFSLDYLEDMVQGIKKSKADHLTLNWGQEFPMLLDAEHEEWGFETTFMLAPRIQSDD